MDPIIDISRTNHNFTVELKRELEHQFRFILYLIILTVLSVLVFSLIIFVFLRRIAKTNHVVNDNILKYNENVEKVIDIKYHQLE